MADRIVKRKPQKGFSGKPNTTQRTGLNPASIDTAKRGKLICSIVKREKHYHHQTVYMIFLLKFEVEYLKMHAYM